MQQRLTCADHAARAVQPALKAVHELMIRENEAGGITRQEVVSMIPPLLLDVQPSHKVLVAGRPLSRRVMIGRESCGWGIPRVNV